MPRLAPCLALLLAARLLAPQPARAAENKYDVLGQTLLPFVGVLAPQSRSANRAMELTLRLESVSHLSRKLTDAKAAVALESPDKLRIRAPFQGEELTICRHGQELWVYPGSKAEALIAAAIADKTLPPPDPRYRLEPFSLPVPAKQLIFLPALFVVQDRGYEALDGRPCRVLDLELFPELARSLGVEGTTATLWVSADYRPARLALLNGRGFVPFHAQIRFEEVKFAPSLPAATWEPTAEQAADVLKITPARYQQLLGLIGGRQAGER